METAVVVALLTALGAAVLFMFHDPGAEDMFDSTASRQSLQSVAQAIAFVRMKDKQTVTMVTADNLVSAIPSATFRNYMQKYLTKHMDFVSSAFSYDATTEILAHKESGRRIYVPKSYP